MPLFAVALMVVGIIFSVMMIMMIIKWSKSYYAPDLSHIEFSDKQFLELIASQNDGFLSVEKAIQLTGLDKKQVKKRFSILHYKGLLNSGYTNSFKYYYSLKFPIKPGPYPALSQDPFLTVGDLMTLFKFFDYRLSVQDICMATNLPVTVIVEEMKYFIKEKIVDQLHHTATDGMSSKTVYVLSGPYRDNPEKHIELQKEINLDLSKLYEKHQLNPKGNKM